MKYLNLLLIFAPVAIIGSFVGWSETLLFVASALAVIPAAGILGRATEELAVHTGPRLGGLLNATLGNAAELIITIFAIRAGLLDLVKASITGSILGNVLLVMGASLLFGGLKNGVQRFDRAHAGVNATQLLLAVLALMIPSLFFFAHTETTGPVESLSLGTAVAMLAIYVLGLLFAFRYTSPEPELAQEVEAEHAGSWSCQECGSGSPGCHGAHRLAERDPGGRGRTYHRGARDLRSSSSASSWCRWWATSPSTSWPCRPPGRTRWS